MQNGLREEINDLVMKYLKRKLRTGEPIDVAEMAHEMAQSFVDMVADQDEEQQAPLLALIMINLGDEYLQRRGHFSPERRDN
jgi:nucleoid-associated protein YejK